MNKIIETQLKSKYGRGGTTPLKLPGSSKLSTMHNTSSLNGKPMFEYPAIDKNLQPSVYDFDGKTLPKYLDNKPR